MTRDMSRRQFLEALRRRGWRNELLWITGITDAEGHSIGIGMVMTRKGRRGWKTDYRASLAKAIREAGKAETVPNRFRGDS